MVRNRPRSLMLAQMFTGMIYDIICYWKFIFELLILIFATPTLFTKLHSTATIVLFTVYALDRFQELLLSSKEQLESLLTDEERNDISQTDRNAYFYRIFLFFRIVFDLSRLKQIILRDNQIAGTRIEDIIRYNFKCLFIILALTVIIFLYVGPVIPFLNPLIGPLCDVAKSLSNFMISSGVQLEMAQVVTPVVMGIFIYSLRSLVVGTLALLYKSPCILKPVTDALRSCIDQLRSYFWRDDVRQAEQQMQLDSTAQTRSMLGIQVVEEVVSPSLLLSGTDLAMHSESSQELLDDSFFHSDTCEPLGINNRPGSRQ